MCWCFCVVFTAVSSTRSSVWGFDSAYTLIYLQRFFSAKQCVISGNSFLYMCLLKDSFSDINKERYQMFCCSCLYRLLGPSHELLSLVFSLVSQLQLPEYCHRLGFLGNRTGMEICVQDLYKGVIFGSAPIQGRESKQHWAEAKLDLQL